MPEVLATAKSEPRFITSDSTSIYWTEPNGGTVMRVGKNGGTPIVLAAKQKSPGFVAVDGNNVYWTNQDANGAVMKVPKKGGMPIIVAGKQNYPATIAFDAASIYWTTGWNNDGAVMKLARSGGKPSVDAVTIKRPFEIFTDGTNLYWRLQDDGTLVKVLPDGTIRRVASDVEEPVMDDAAFYWVDTTQKAVLTVPLSGGSATALASAEGISPSSKLCVDGAGVYFTTRGFRNSGTISRVPKAGGMAVTIVNSNVKFIEHIIADDRDLYWTDGDQRTVMKVQKF